MRKNLLAAAFGVVLAFLCIEIFFRLLPGFLPLEVQLRTGRTGRNFADLALERYEKAYYDLFYNDPYLGVAYKPDLNVVLKGHPDYTYHMRTISLGYSGIGFRDDGIPSAGDDIHGPVYAVAVGDSFTSGDGVEESQTWVENVQRRVGQPVVNLGVSRYASTQNERMLTRYGLPLQPRLVLWGFFPNDFYGEWIIRRWLASGEPDIDAWWAKTMENAPSPSPDQTVTRRTATPVGAGSGLRGFLHRHVISYELLKFGLRLGDYRWQGGAGPGGSIRYDDGRLHLMFQPDAWERWLNQDDQTIRQTQEPILAARAQAEAQGAAFVVILIPFKEAAYWDMLTARAPGWKERLDVGRPLRLMLDFCAANGLRCLDLTSAFRQHAAAGEQLYFRSDGHWNVAGHALAADLIYNYLSDQGLLP